jgi:D(-)-tartrate dehydratase
MKITAIHEIAVPVRSTMRNAVFDFSEMTTSVVAVHTDVTREGRPVVGYAFNSTGRYACGAPMRARFIPRLLRAPPESLLDATGTNLDPERALAVMMKAEKPGGHSERSIPIGTIEVALWDAVGKIAGKPTYQVLADRYNGGRVPKKVFCYTGGGWYRPGGTVAELVDELKRHLDAGYTLVKIKFGGLSLAEDLERIEAALKLLPSSQALAVDCNAKFDRIGAIAAAKALAPYNLRWFEEPCDPIDFETCAELASFYAPPLATGENLYSLQDVKNLARLGGFRRDHDVIQIDPPQCYGYSYYASIVCMLREEGWTTRTLYPHGGNQMSLALAAGLDLGGCEAYPGVFGDFGGYADDARVDNGYLTLSDRPGIGFEGQSGLYALMKGIA